MNLAAIDLNLLVAFDALMAQRSVTRAARAVGLSQPAMSNALARLRALFGDQLLVRGQSGMVPTPRALELHAAVTSALRGLEQAFAAREAFDPAQAERTFRIAMAEDAAFYILPGLMGRLAAEAPGIDLQVLSTAHVPGVDLVADGEAEASIGLVPRSLPKEVHTRPVFTERLVCVARRGHPAFAAAAEPVGLADFLAWPHVSVRPSVRAKSRIDDALARIGRSRRVALSVPHFLMVPYLLQDSDMIACLAERVAWRLGAPLGLEVRAVPLDLTPHEAHLAWHRRFDEDVAHRWLRETIVTASAEF